MSPTIPRQLVGLVLLARETSARVIGIVKKTAQKFASTVRGRLETAVAARGDVTLVIE